LHAPFTFDGRPAALFGYHFILKTYPRNWGIATVWMTERCGTRANRIALPGLQAADAQILSRLDRSR
jgi:hypothetical protein